MRHTNFISIGLCFAVTVAGCGEAEPGSGAPTAGSSGASGSSSTTSGTQAVAGGTSTAGTAGQAPTSDDPLLPWAVGNAWTYRVTKNGTTTDKTTTVVDLEAVGGTGPNAKLMANHVVTAKGASSADKTESWQAPAQDAPLRIVRYRELAFDSAGMLSGETYYDPPKIHIDGSAAHTVKGATWTETYTEASLPVGMSMTSHQSSDVWTVIDDDETVTVPAGTFMHVVHFRKVGTSMKEYWYARGVGKLKETGTQTEELVKYTIE